MTDKQLESAAFIIAIILAIFGVLKLFEYEQNYIVVNGRDDPSLIWIQKKWWGMTQSSRQLILVGGKWYYRDIFHLGDETNAANRGKSDQWREIPEGEGLYSAERD